MYFIFGKVFGQSLRMGSPAPNNTHNVTVAFKKDNAFFVSKIQKRAELCEAHFVLEKCVKTKRNFKRKNSYTKNILIESIQLAHQKQKKKKIPIA